MTTQNITLTDDWLEVAIGTVSIVLVTGPTFWAYNDSSPPPDDSNFIPLPTPDGAPFLYEGTERTYCRIAGPNKGVVASTGAGRATVISVNPII